MKDIIIALAIGLTLLWVLFRIIDEKPIFSFRWKEPGKQYISYKTYKRLSAIAPERWWISDDSGFYVCYSCEAFKNGYEHLYMNSPISIFQLWLDIRKQKKEETSFADDKEMEKLIESWKKDLDKFNRREENESSGNHHI